MKTLATAALGIACARHWSTHRKKSYRLNSSSEIVKKLPCEAFSKNSDDSWTLVATVVVGGKSSSGNIYRHSAQSRILDQRCSGKPQASATQEP